MPSKASKRHAFASASALPLSSALGVTNMSASAVRPPLLPTLGKRVLALPGQIWRNLGTNQKYRWPSATGYTLGALSTMYSFFALLYDYNIDLKGILEIPLQRFFTEQVLPFLASPLVYVGISLGGTGRALLVVSAIGGAILANAEFRTRFRLSKHVFVKRESGPRFDLEALKKNPGLPEPPSHTLLSRAAVYGAALLLGYSMLGLIAFTVFVPFGVYFFFRDIRYLLAWTLTNVLYVVEHLLAPYERWGDDQYWGTRWFLAVFTRRRRLDSFLETDYIDFWRIDSLDPKQRNWTSAKRSVRDGGRVVALTMWLLLSAIVVWQLVT